MAKATKLLNDDGSASMATALLMSHHAFRRDLACFRRALGRIAESDETRVSALKDEWKHFRGALHGHHTVEDTAVFPDLKNREASIAPAIDRLSADHRRIDPILAKGDGAFEALPSSHGALEVVLELEALLDQHLEFEEAEVVPFLRGATSFPAPSTDEEAKLYAGGFAWSSHGVASEVLAELDKMLPEPLTSRLPAARAAFAERCARVWGTSETGSSHTSLPAPPRP